ncbi:hypothetical protein ACGFJ7_26440 [Actinoplanes sp. NPDC048988]
MTVPGSLAPSATPVMVGVPGAAASTAWVVADGVRPALLTASTLNL